MRKSAYKVNLCRTNIKYFNLWERGGGKFPSLKPTVILTMPPEKEVICSACEHYNKYRCVKIDLGCRVTFLEFANNPKKSCPLGLWPTALDSCEGKDVG